MYMYNPRICMHIVTLHLHRYNMLYKHIFRMHKCISVRRYTKQTHTAYFLVEYYYICICPLASTRT